MNIAASDIILKAGVRVSQRWSERLARVLQSLVVYAPEGSCLAVTPTANGRALGLTRPVLSLRLARTPGGGIPARNGTTGKWGSATCQFYEDTTNGTDSFTKLTGPNDVVYNRTNVAAGGNLDIIVLEESGFNFVVGAACP